ncbi:MAG: hypothetical protein RMI79_06320, partial [Nitrososphaerota archaeon]|nr:hypothetical protein [Nitrososphaerota archaeon]
MLERLRVLIAAVALSTTIYAVGLSGLLISYTVSDYLLWLSFFLILYSSWMDLRLFWKEHSYASTLIFDLAAWAFAIIGRIGSWLLSCHITGRFVPPIGGSIINADTLLTASLLLQSAAFAVISTTIHTLKKRPIIVAETESLRDALKHLSTTLYRIFSKRSVLLTTSFMAGFLLRIYPEYVYWPLPIGWDTLEF